MSDTTDAPDRARRAFSDHGSFEAAGEGDRYVSTSTAFDGVVTPAAAEDGQLRFDVTVTVPTLGAAATEGVADVVEDGWFDAFERRVVDVGGVTRKSREFDVDVTRHEETVVVETSLVDINERRGVDDAAAVIDFVEGTYVQGIVPGYEYEGPAASLLSKARRQGKSGGVP
ncbi:DUF5813 family protein [Haloparvum sedimenti]|uniref:DUF5813 family protein n=1 Tax=Haloparvum sedimenti TaxID=1678448 RepID=UPI00071E7847|nr:DUF5813 family protein [Haloparvum sedimenti]